MRRLTEYCTRAGVQKRNALTIYDLRNKFIAFASKFDGVIDMVPEWGSLFVLTETKKVWQLRTPRLPLALVTFGTGIDVVLQLGVPL